MITPMMPRRINVKKVTWRKNIDKFKKIFQNIDNLGRIVSRCPPYGQKRKSR
jgi:hypothetical protein